MSNKIVGKYFERSNKDMMYLGFNDACLTFTVQFHRHMLDDLCESVITALPHGYNNFEAQKFVEEFNQIRDKVLFVEFGRESSPVCYIVFNSEVTKQEATRIMKSFSYADERSIRKDDTYTECYKIRLWWD
jgi:hypothetical protein